MEPIIQAERLDHIYSAGTLFEHRALVGVDLIAYRGECLGITGHTSSSESTLIQHLNGPLKPTSDRVLFKGRDIWEGKERTRQARSQMELVSQYPEYQLLEETTYKDIAFSPKNMGLDERGVDRRMRETAQFVGLREDMLEKSPFELSDGQERRVAIVGIVAMEPSMLILDESTTGLDPVGMASTLDSTHGYHTAKNAAIIIVSHSVEEVARTVDRLVVINDGRVPFSGAPREIFTHGNRLGAMGLGVPATTRVFHRLRAMGMDIDSSVYITEQARDAVLAKLGHAGQQRQSTPGEREAV